MSEMTGTQVESYTGGTIISGSVETTISSFSIDSRSVQSGDLFFAIRGKNTDGHQYIASAFSKGACGAVVDLGYQPEKPFSDELLLVRVNDTHQALKDLAANIRRRWRGTVVAVTGSVGKTTTREFIAHCLQSDYEVHRSPGNYNNLFGLPLSVLGLRPEHHIGIFEMGMSEFGEIAEMCRIARPNLGVITSVAAAHLEFFDSLEEIARAKGELAKGLEPDGTLFYNIDDPLVREIANDFAGHTVSYGLSQDADVCAENIEVVSLKETRFSLSVTGKIQQASIPLAGTHWVLNTLPGIGIGRHFRIPLQQLVESLKGLSLLPMRGQVVRFTEGITLVDDSYNSNPRALMKMIETLSNLKSFGRRILVAGEMLELGGETSSFHYQCGMYGARCGLEMVVAVHGSAAELARGARDGGMNESQVRFFEDAESTSDFIVEEVRSGDALFVKGSRGIHLERVVERLRATFTEEIS